MAPLIILMYALFASSFSVGKVLLSYSSYIFIVGIRFFLAGAVLLAYQVLWLRKRIYVKRSHLWLYAQIIILGIYSAYLFRFWGMNYLSSTKTSLLFNSAPFFAALYSYFFFNERMTPKQWVGLVIGFLGMIPILITGSPEEKQLGEFLFISWPELSIILAVALQSYSWIVFRKLVKDKNHSPMLVNSITMCAGGILALATSAWFEGLTPVTDASHFWGWLIYVIIVSNIICYNLYGYLLRHYSATFVSFAGFIVPFFTALYGWGFLNETITWHFYASCLIVFIGLYLFYQDELKNSPAYAQNSFPRSK